MAAILIFIKVKKGWEVVIAPQSVQSVKEAKDWMGKLMIRPPSPKAVKFLQYPPAGGEDALSDQIAKSLALESLTDRYRALFKAIFHLALRTAKERRRKKSQSKKRGKRRR